MALSPSPRIAPHRSASLGDTISIGGRSVRLSLSCGKRKRALLAAIKEMPSEFRRCWYHHQPAGIAVLMATSRPHEFSAVDADDLVKVFCHTAGLAFVALGSATAQSEDRRHSVDPDESFLIGGERAERFRRIESTEGQEAAIADLGEQPQDLAVEVERAANDDVRNEVYRAVGVLELWECPRSEPRILDLQAPDGIRPVEGSRILAGVRAEHLPATIDEIKRRSADSASSCSGWARRMTDRDDEGGPRHIGEFIEGLMDIINGGGWQIWRAENDISLKGAADATKHRVERGIAPVGILVPLDAAALDALQRWAERTSAGAGQAHDRAGGDSGRDSGGAFQYSALASRRRDRYGGPEHMSGEPIDLDDPVGGKWQGDGIARWHHYQARRIAERLSIE